MPHERKIVNSDNLSVNGEKEVSVFRFQDRKSFLTPDTRNLTPETQLRNLTPET
jgi:hypothetical protein